MLLPVKCKVTVKYTLPVAAIFVSFHLSISCLVVTFVFANAHKVSKV